MDRMSFNGYSWIRPGTNDTALRNTTNTSHLSPRRKTADVHSLFSLSSLPILRLPSLPWLLGLVCSGRLSFISFLVLPSQLDHGFDKGRVALSADRLGDPSRRGFERLASSMHGMEDPETILQ
jgi:hypothetical protein